MGPFKSKVLSWKSWDIDVNSLNTEHHVIHYRSLIEMKVACFLIFLRIEQQQLMKSKEQMFTISDADAEHTL